MTLYILTERMTEVVHEGETLPRKSFSLIGDPIGCDYDEGVKDEETGDVLVAPEFTVRCLTPNANGYLNSAKVRDRSGDHADPEASFRQVVSTLDKKGILVNLSSFKLTKAAPSKAKTQNRKSTAKTEETPTEQAE